MATLALAVVALVFLIVRWSATRAHFITGIWWGVGLFLAGALFMALYRTTPPHFWIVLGASFFVGLLFATEGWVLKLPSALGRAAQATGGVELIAQQLRRVAPIPRPAPVGQGVTAEESVALLKTQTPKIKPKTRRPGRLTDDPDENDRFDGEIVDQPVEGPASELRKRQADHKDDATTRTKKNVERHDSESERISAPTAEKPEKGKASRHPIVNFPSPQQAA